MNDWLIEWMNDWMHQSNTNLFIIVVVVVVVYKYRMVVVNRLISLEFLFNKIKQKKKRISNWKKLYSNDTNNNKNNNKKKNRKLY